MCCSTSSYPPVCPWTLGGFRVLAAVANAAANTGVQVPRQDSLLQQLHLLRTKPRRGVAGSVSRLRSLRAVSQRGCDSTVAFTPPLYARGQQRTSISPHALIRPITVTVCPPAVTSTDPAAVRPRPCPEHAGPARLSVHVGRAIGCFAKIFQERFMWKRRCSSNQL